MNMSANGQIIGIADSGVNLDNCYFWEGVDVKSQLLNSGEVGLLSGCVVCTFTVILMIGTGNAKQPQNHCLSSS